MFAPYCPSHRSRVLLGYESVIDIEQTPSGPKVLLQCHCGVAVAHDATAETAMPHSTAAVRKPERVGQVGHPS
jgi:hypothetical protein